MTDTAKGYWLVRFTTTDPEGFAAYAAAAAPATAPFGAQLIVRGGQNEVVEGTSRPNNVVVEFASYAEALACYRSDAYQSAVALRKNAAEFDVVIVEGVTPA